MEATHLRHPNAAAGQEGVGPPPSLPSPRPHLAHVFLALVDHCVMFSLALPAVLLLMCIFLSFQPQDPGTVDDC